jgi:hypothetical protein
VAKIPTADGRLLDLDCLRPSDIDFRVVATSLSNQCRWNGHVGDYESDVFYSVCEHSTLLSDYFRLRHPDKPLLAKWAHVHDAPEYLVGDVVRPLKSESFDAAEAKVARAVYARLDLVGDLPPEVKEADDRIRLDEAARFGIGWKGQGEPLGVRPYGVRPIVARGMWWQRGLDLFGQAWK